MSDGSQAESECAKFVGRDRDLCRGRGEDGRPTPKRAASNTFRARHQLPELPAKSITLRSGGTSGKQSATVTKPAKPRTKGVGTHLKLILESLSLKYRNTESCGCTEAAALMDQIGPQECRARFDEFVAKLEEKAGKLSWWDTLRIAAASVPAGLTFSLSAAGLLTEAINRAEAEIERSAAVVDAE